MNRRNKKYADFKKICGVLHVSEARLEKLLDQCIRSKSDNISIYNKVTDMRYYLKPVCVEGETCMVELYEVHGGTENKVIFRNWVCTRRPKNRKREAAISEIFGVVILIGIAGAGAVLFYSIAIERAETEERYDTELVVFKLAKLSAADSVALAEISFLTYGEGAVSLSFGEDLESVDLLDSDGEPLDGDTTRVEELSSGRLVTFEGLVDIPEDAGRGSHIHTAIILDDGQKVQHVVRISG